MGYGGVEEKYDFFFVLFCNGRIQQAGYNGINKARRGYDVRPFSSKSTSRMELILQRGRGGVF